VKTIKSQYAIKCRPNIVSYSPAKEECELTGVSARAVTLHALSGDATTVHAG